MEILEKGLFRLTVPLAESPLKEIHPYLITGGERNLLIDTAFNTDECEAVLLEELGAAGVSLDDTDIFLTHMHVDHTGLISRLKRETNKIYISAEDQKLLDGFQGKEHWNWVNTSNDWAGTPDEYALRPELHIAHMKRASGLVPIVVAEVGKQLQYGDFTLEIVSLAGHTPGHVGLWDKERGILFGGDHLLERITPNIATWDLDHDYVVTYCDNICKLLDMNLTTIYPAHRQPPDIKLRVKECLEHHEQRFATVLEILKKEGRPVSAFEIAYQMEWGGGKSYQDLMPQQRWFACTEILAHLQSLMFRNQVLRNNQGEAFLYWYVGGKTT